MGKVIALSNQKGGIGKTTCAINIAASLGVLNKKTLLIDFDPQGNSTTGLGISKKDCKKSSYSLLIGQYPANECILDTKFKNLSVVPSNLNLAGAEIEISGLEKRESLLREALAQIVDSFDYILIDCPPSLGLLTLNAMVASDGIIIPMVCEFFAMEGISQLALTVRQIGRLYNPNLSITGIILTMYDKRTNHFRAVEKEIQKYYSDKIFKTRISRTIKLAEAPSFGMPVFYYDEKGKSSEQFLDLTHEILRRI
ncbi:MAG: ParA family protein [Clostridia bacterium]|nr:ParA family protein [Clostridia bacterium]